jgi:hypothetical protein
MKYIGIDPDIDKNGVAIWDSEKKQFDSIAVLDFWDLISVFIDLKFWAYETHVIIEAGWLIKKSNWHGGRGVMAQRIAKNVGMNHQVGILLAEYCERYDIPYELVKPKGKIKADTFKKLTGWPERTNQEKRDAAMLVFGL